MNKTREIPIPEGLKPLVENIQLKIQIQQMKISMAQTELNSLQKDGKILTSNIAAAHGFGVEEEVILDPRRMVLSVPVLEEDENEQDDIKAEKQDTKSY